MQVIEFFKRQLLIAHVFGIPVRINYSWFVVLILMTGLTAAYLPASLAADFLTKSLLGFFTALVFFISIFLHELGHALAARFEKLEVREIVLHPFGGLARFKRAPDNPRTEFRVAIAGPAASFLLALFFLGVWAIFNSFGTNVMAPIAFLLFFWNLLLAIFNLFPGYPLDGGRVLRAFLWKRGKDLNEATILTGKAGQIIGAALIVIGLIMTVVRGDINGLWTALIGIFLYESAYGIIKQTNESETTLVSEVMSLPISVAPEDNILHFVDNILPQKRLTTFLVAKDKQLYGILMLEDLKNLERSEWHKTKVREVMRLVTTDYFVDSDSLLGEARELMKHNGVGALGVIDEQGNLVGYLQRSRIRRVKSD
jgi:Zn-dependent protease/CBS domain-containing protein